MSSIQQVIHNYGIHISDYAPLGHAEVVRISVPESSFPSFCIEYFNLFSSKGYQPDQWGEHGSKYRNLVGVLGGVSSQYSKELIAALKSAGDKLDFAAGKGNDPDLSGLCFNMDSASFSFNMAEQYHQFHAGFNLGENYPISYNSLADKLVEERTSNCFDGVGARQ
jgi:hypothetical protein